MACVNCSQAGARLPASCASMRRTIDVLGLAQPPRAVRLLAGLEQVYVGPGPCSTVAQWMGGFCGSVLSSSGMRSQAGGCSGRALRLGAVMGTLSGCVMLWARSQARCCEGCVLSLSVVIPPPPFSSHAAIWWFCNAMLPI